MDSIGQLTKKWAESARINVNYFETTTSTNLMAKEMAQSESADISLYVSDHQTAGRGRGQNTWFDSGAGQNLMCTWSLNLNGSPPPLMSCRMGLALFKALSQSWPWLNFSLKAPNDIYLNDKKVAGILLENIQQGSKNRLLIGIGLNVYSHPNLSSGSLSATDLNQDLKNSITTNNWTDFLDRMLLEVTLSATKLEFQLDQNEQESLKHTLNLRPSLPEKVVAVTQDGSIHTKSKKTSWTEL